MKRWNVGLRGIARVSLAGWMGACAWSAAAEIRLPKVIGDHAVLQRDRPLHIWGWATPGAQLTVRLHGQSMPAVADKLGEWGVWLMPEAAGGPYTLTVQGEGSEGSAKAEDLLMGDVWLASGQSNMEMPMSGWLGGSPAAVLKNSEAEIKAAGNPQLRLLLVEHESSDFPLKDVKASWKLCTPENAASFSAIAYFFGREIAAKEHVPVGLIDASWGGTIVDAWISLEGLAASPASKVAFANRARFQADLAQSDAIAAEEKREDEEAKAAGKPKPGHPWRPYGPSWQPAGLYNGMIAPLNGYGIKGFLWYQGESDATRERAPVYRVLMQELIEDWRGEFAQGDLPFLLVQLTSFNAGEDWGTIRDAQRRALGLRNTALAVTLDVGDPTNVHPPDKQTVAARLALAARGMVYGEKIEYESPLFRQATAVPGGLRVWFDHGQGLMTKDATVQGFELAGADGHFVAAEAAIDGETVVVKSTAVSEPRFVRYAFTGIAPPSLYNAAGLPMATFTSGDGANW